MHPTVRWLIVLSFLLALLGRTGGASLAAPALPPLPAPPIPIVTPGWVLPVPAAATPAASVSGQPQSPAAPAITFPALPDPNDIARNVFGAVLTTMLGLFGDALAHVMGPLAGGGHNFITTTPPDLSYGNGTVQQLGGAVRAVAEAAMVVLVALGGLAIIAGGPLRLPYADALILLSRSALALLGIVLVPWLLGLGIDLNNALCAAIGPQLPAWDAPLPPTPTVVEALVRVVYLLTGLFLLLQLLMRLVLVDFLLALAPLAIALWTLPQTQGWWQLWTRRFIGAVYSQVGQVACLKLGLGLIATVGGTVGGAGTSPGLVPLFMGIALMVLTLQVPRHFEGYAGNSLVTAFLAAASLRRAAGAGGRLLLGTGKRAVRLVAG